MSPKELTINFNDSNNDRISRRQAASHWIFLSVRPPVREDIALTTGDVAVTLAGVTASEPALPFGLAV